MFLWRLDLVRDQADGLVVSFRLFVHFRTKQVDQIGIGTLVDRTRRFDFEDEDEEKRFSLRRREEKTNSQKIVSRESAVEMPVAMADPLLMDNPLMRMKFRCRLIS